MPRLFATAMGCALVASLACGSAAALEAVAGTQLVMHVGPGAEHRNIATIPADTHLTVNGCSEADGWCLVRYDGRHGWIEGESLDVIGFSRPAPQPAAAPPVTERVVVQVPVVNEVPVHRFVTADDVVIGIDEQTGLAATLPRTGKRFDLGKRKGRGLTFKRRGFRHDGHVRRHGSFRHAKLGKHGVHAGKKGDVRRLMFRKPGSRFGKHVRAGRLHLGKDVKLDRLRFGKPGQFFGHRKGGGLHFGKAHFKTRFGKHGTTHVKRFGKRGKALGHSGKVRFGGGLRIKGGWRP